jgi:dipeptidase E
MQRILAIGGGGFLMEESASPIDEYIRDLTGKSRPKICFLPTPSGDLPEGIEKFYRAYAPRSCEASHLAFFRKPSDGSVPIADFEPHLLAQDAIFVGGGNTKSALGVWREWGVDQVLRRAYAAGVLLSGMSAGAMCWFDSGLTDSYWGAGYRPLPCLGLLKGGCAVHYGSDPQRRERLHAALEASAIPPSIAIDDFAAVLYQDGVIARTLAWRPDARAYSVFLQGDAIIELPQKTESL